MSAKKHRVSLTDTERQTLKSYLRSGVHPARFLTRVRILLLADKGLGDPEIARQVGVSKSTPYNLRRRFAREGLQAALHEKPRPGAPAKFSGQDEANLAVLACTQPPEGHERWTVRLLADRLVRLEMVESISSTTVQEWLKKTNSNRGSRNSGASGRSRVNS